MGKLKRKKTKTKNQKKCKNYFRVTMITAKAMVKCRRNKNFEGMYTELSTGNMMDFDYCEKNLRNISSKILFWHC